MLSPNNPSGPTSRRSNRAHLHCPAQGNAGRPCKGQHLPGREKCVPQAFRNPRDHTNKNKFKSILPSESTSCKCSQSLACPQGWGPKGPHQKLQDLTLRCQSCLFFHGKHTQLLKPHLPPAPSPSQACLGKPGEQKATPAALTATQTCGLSY